jgi:HK97 gp10 family phage protein
MPVHYNQRELQALKFLAEDPEVLDALQDIGDQVAERARELAPKRVPSERDNQQTRKTRPGAGAESIEAQLVNDPITGTEVRVSWDRQHFYMQYAELGSEHQEATPFLRPAAAPYQD